MVQTLEGELGTAVVDGDERCYRYHLTRDFGEGEGSVAFIMLNPSMANHECNDETVCKCIRLAKHWGYRTLEVGNLYARYATKPADLRNYPVPIAIGPHNDAYLRCIATRCPTVVAAWGGWGEQWGPADLGGFRTRDYKKRADDVVQLLLDAMANAGREPAIYRLGRLTDAGYPRHPSRLARKDEELRLWEPQP